MKKLSFLLMLGLIPMLLLYAVGVVVTLDASWLLAEKIIPLICRVIVAVYTIVYVVLSLYVIIRMEMLKDEKDEEAIKREETRN